MTEPSPIEITADFPLRFGHLSKFAKSPAHYLEARTNDAKQTSAMEKGSALHAVVLGTAEVIAYPGKVRNGKQWEAFEAEHQGKHILTGSAYEKVMGMAEAVWSHGLAKELLFSKGAIAENTLRVDLYGKPCRATPDVRNGYCCELKSSATAEPEQFMRHAQRMLYQGQIAFYLQAMAAARVPVERDGYVVVVEATAPHPVVVLHATERTLDMGDRAIRLWFERLKTCEEEGYYPGYVQSVVTWDIEEEIELQFAEDAASEEAA